MDKTTINLDILLPEVPDERDACVQRVIRQLSGREGIDKVHVIPAADGGKAKLCFHYQPGIISLEKVKWLARQAGAAITEHYGHLLLEVTGIRHVRHARLIESGLAGIDAVLFVSVSAAGWVSIEYDKHKMTPPAIIDRLEQLGLSVRSPEKQPGSVKKPVAAQQEPTDEKEKTREQHDHSPSTHAKHAHSTAAHDHAHGIFGEQSELIFAIISGVSLGIGFGLSFIRSLPAAVPIGCYLAAYFFGGFYTSKEAIQGISKGQFEIDFLMLVAAIGAAFLGEWAEGALLLFLFSLGHSLEHYAMAKAKKSIAALTELAPKTALLKNGEGVKEVGIDTLKTGDIVLVKPHAKIAADGFVIKGNSDVNQAPITGESMPVDKTAVEDAGMDIANAKGLEARHTVFAGTINGANNLEIKVTKVAADSTISRLVTMVNEAQTQKSPTQNFTDRIEKFYVPSVLMLVGLLLFAFLVIDEPFSSSFYRAMAVLVAASPCALAISTPSAVLSGVARAARGGVLIKGGKPLEELGALTAIAFDKTGTLTTGKPRLSGVYPLQENSEETLLELVVAVEQLSDHPLAKAMVKAGSERLQKKVSPAADLTAIQGKGVRATYQDSTVHIGHKGLFTEKNNGLPDEIRQQVEELEGKGHTTMLVEKEDQLLGMITLMDVARDDAKASIARLKKLGIRKMIMLTGDNQQVAESIAADIGITDAWGDLLPEEKVAAIEKLKASEKKVAMVGDGVNDAPAMAKSTVGIAMGAAGSDVALETADIALMADKLDRLPFAIGLSKKAHGIIKQNLVISLGMVVILIPLTILGIAHIGPAVIGHEGSTLLVVFNALRLLGYRGDDR